VGERREDAAREEAAAAERRARAARANAELSPARRAMGEELAREVGRRGRLRLGEGDVLPGEARPGRLLHWLLRFLGG
jgi:hypothetical protein